MMITPQWKPAMMFRAFALAMILLAASTACRGEDPQAGPLELTKLPHGAHGHRAHRLGDRLLLFGGYGIEATAFDLKTSKWSEFPPMKVRKVFFSSAVVEGRIYAVGGDPQSEEPAVIERFDPQANAWEVLLRSKELPKSHHAVAAAHGKIFIIGGFPGREPLAHVFEPGSGELKAMPPLPGEKRGDHFHFLATLAGRPHVLGGMRFAEGDSGPMNQHWMWDGEAWRERAALPIPSMAKFGPHGVLGGKLYLFEQSDGLHHIYDPETDRWSDSAAEMPAHLAMPAAIAEGPFLYLLGGIDPTRRIPPDAVHIFDSHANRWRMVE